MSFRLFTTRRSLGALNLYARPVGAFDTDDLLEGHILAAMTTASVAASLKEEQLVQALESRTVIEQATGMLMERFGLDPDAAFSVIRRLSQSYNVKIHTVAREMVRTGQLPPDGQGDHRPAWSERGRRSRAELPGPPRS